MPGAPGVQRKDATLKALKVAIAILVSTVLISSGASALERDEPESCQAINPVQPKCTFTVTSASTSGTVTGAVGQGDWIVVVKRGKTKMKFGPTSTEPEPVSFDYVAGDKVTATVTSAGGWVVAGHD
ncbi:MAG: hypothetical protein QOG04_318 [Actinomycetota bacterium]|jgi:hypothetical protein|nr:hypothetical protein [Actinomycetota bacterium]